MNDRYKSFEKVYLDSIETIKRYCDDENQEMRHIANWLMDTNGNPYSIFFDCDDASRMSCAEGMAELLHKIHHAMIDDGDITFRVIGGFPQITFDCVDEQTSSYPCKILDNAFEFTEAFDKQRKRHLKKCFLLDYKKSGFDPLIVESYSKREEYSDIFDPLWVNEF